MGNFAVSPRPPHEGRPATPAYAFLNDEPLRGSQYAEGDDVLGTRATAGRLADLIAASRNSTPFTIAVDAGWGMGKSSLMHQVAEVLAQYPRTECVWFNAWTSHGADALEGLLKSVLMRFDRNALRRALNRARENRTALRVMRTTAAVALGLLHAGRVVDELWSRMEADAATRNDIRQLIKDMATEWSSAGAGPGRRRMLVVFVDDLDRCPDETVHAVCEAVKVYLDVPGLVFVLGCDQSRLAAAGAAGGPSLSADYLEKIVQISFRVPTPDVERAAALVRRYAERSGTERFITPGLAGLVAERTGRNPRRIKRLINGLVMYQLDQRWAGVEPEATVRAVLLQHLYPDFHRAAGQPDGTDLIGDFAQYYEARGMLRRRAVNPDDPRWSALDGFADRWLLPRPDRGDAERWDGYLDLLEQQLPPVFPELAADLTFVRLITELNGLPYADQVRELIRQGSAGPSALPLLQQPPPHSRPFEPSSAEEHIGPEPAPAEGAPSVDGSVESASTGSYRYPRPPGYPGQAGRRQAGSSRWDLPPLHVLWVDDKPESVVYLVQELRQIGALVSTALSTQEAVDLLRHEAAPDVLVSDTKRDGDAAAGFRAVAEYRAAGYEGPVVFYTGQISGQNHRQAEEAGAVGLTNSWAVLLDLLEGIARAQETTTDS